MEWDELFWLLLRAASYVEKDVFAGRGTTADDLAMKLRKAALSVNEYAITEQGYTLPSHLLPERCRIASNAN